jgi:cysteine desulfurase / selenocysteine lyase
MPERLEAGTLNSFGLAGLLEGVKFIVDTGLDKIRVHETYIRKTLYENLAELPGIKLYGPLTDENSSCIVSFTIEGADSGEIGYILENNYGILCRTGLHCAPLAHKAINTFPEGTIRLSPGYFTVLTDIDFLVNAIEEISTLVRD